MIMVLALGMSSPDSMMLVANSTSKARSSKAVITSSSSEAVIWPWAVTILTSGTNSRMRSATLGISSMRGQT